MPYLKRALIIVSNNYFIAHTEQIYKEVYLVQISNMFRTFMCIFYLRLIINTLPLYFNEIKPELSPVFDNHAIKHMSFHLPNISNEFAERKIQYQVIRILNNVKCGI